MAGAISNLYVELKLSADNFINGLHESEREAKAWAKELKPLKEAAQELGEAMSVVGDVVAVAMAEMAHKTAEYGEEIENMQKRTGVGVVALQQMAIAAEEQGASIESLGTGLKFLSKSMELADEGSKKVLVAYKNLGISTAELKSVHGDAAAMMSLVADRIKGMADPSEHAADLTAVLGKTWTDLIPMLSDGSEGLKRAGDEASRTGKVLSEESIAAAAQFNHQLEDLTHTLEGVGAQIGVALIPTLKEYAVIARDVIGQALDFVKTHQEMIDIAFKVAGVIGVGGALLLGLSAVLAILPQVTVAWELLTGAISASTLGIGAVVAAIIYFRKEIAEGLMAALAEVVGMFSRFVDWAATLADKVGANGLAMHLHDAAFSTQGFSLELEAGVTQLIKESDAAGLAADAAKAHGSETKGATEALKAHFTATADNTEQLKELAKAQEKAYRASHDWSTKYLEDLEKQGNADLTYQTKKLLALNAAQSAAEENQKRWAEKYVQGLEDLAAADLRYQNGRYEREIEVQIKLDDERIKMLRKQQDDNAAYIKKTNDEVGQSAGKIFDDMFVRGQGVFSGLQAALKGGALSIGRTLFEDVVGALMGPIKRAFDEFFGNVLNGLLKGFSENLGQSVASGLSKGQGGGGGGIGSLLGGILGPVGLAVGAFGIVSSLLGKKSEPVVSTAPAYSSSVFNYGFGSGGSSIPDTYQPGMPAYNPLIGGYQSFAAPAPAAAPSASGDRSVNATINVYGNGKSDVELAATIAQELNKLAFMQGMQLEVAR